MAEKVARASPPKSKGVRRLTLLDHLPNAELLINEKVYDIVDVCRGKRVLDIGCGYGRNRELVELIDGEWVGVEPYEGGAHTVAASAESLPFKAGSFDVVIMDAVLEHIPNVSAAFAETARVLKPGGCFIGYAAFMECFHEISYSHLSFMALDSYSTIHGLKLERVGGGRRFGIDYHLGVLLYPLPFNWARPIVAAAIRGHLKVKSLMSYIYLRMGRGADHSVAYQKASLYYKFQCLRQSSGFVFLIRKPIA